MTPEKATKFLAIARSVGELSKDRNRKVGAVAVGPSGEIRAMGYNGFPRGCDDTAEDHHKHYESFSWTEHAERNLIYNAARVGVPLEGCIIVVTDLFPCMDCARGIVQAGFKAVVSDAQPNERWAESNAKARELFAEVGVEVVMVGEAEHAGSDVAYYAKLTLNDGIHYLAVWRADGWHLTQGDGNWEDPEPTPDTMILRVVKTT